MRLPRNRSAVAVIAVTLLAAMTVPATAQAAHDTPLYRAACEYREAVLDFEREVFRSSHFDRDIRRLADALEDASGLMRTAARDGNRLDRAFSRWEEIECLEPRVIQAVFSVPRCPSHAILELRYERLARAHALVDQELALLQQVSLRPVIEVPPPVVLRPAPVQPFVRPSHPQIRFGGSSFGLSIGSRGLSIRTGSARPDFAGRDFLGGFLGHPLDRNSLNQNDFGNPNFGSQNFGNQNFGSQHFGRPDPRFNGNFRGSSFDRSAGQVQRTVGTSRRGSVGASLQRRLD